MSPLSADHLFRSAAPQVDPQKALLDAEVEKILQQKQAIEAMERVGPYNLLQ